MCVPPSSIHPFPNPSNHTQPTIRKIKNKTPQENYHEFCRLLGRLKANYQLCELVRTEGFVEWCDLAAAFTVKSFQQWQWFANRWVRMDACVLCVSLLGGGVCARSGARGCLPD